MYGQSFIHRSIYAIHIQETASNSCQLSTTKMGRYLTNWLLLAWNHKCLELYFGHKTLELKSFYYISIIWKVWQLCTIFYRIWVQYFGQTYPNLSKPIWTYLNLSKPIWTYLKLSEPNQTYPNQSEPIWTNLNLMRQKRMEEHSFDQKVWHKNQLLN